MMENRNMIYKIVLFFYLTLVTPFGGNGKIFGCRLKKAI